MFRLRLILNWTIYEPVSETFKDIDTALIFAEKVVQQGFLDKDEMGKIRLFSPYNIKRVEIEEVE